MQFGKIIAQEQAKAHLIRLAAEDRIPHAQLLLAPQGSGSLALAIAFAQYVLCENRQPTDSCGVCRQCNKVNKFIHPDVHYAYPTVGTQAISTTFLKQWTAAIAENPYLNVQQWLQRLGADNKQGNITKDECVSIVKKLSLKPFEGRYKILIMWLPEYLGKEGNRLLKLIEEPPDNTLFLLVAEQQEQILNTILSRCQLLKLNALPDEAIANALRQRANVSEAAAFQAAHLADGNFNEALLLLDSTENDHSQLFVQWLRTCYKGNGGEMVAWVNDFAAKGREPQKFFFQYAEHFLREFLHLLIAQRDDQVRLQPAEIATATNMLKVLSFEKVAALTSLFDEVTYHIERNANPKILFLDASIRVHRIVRQP